jgi:hypothetical protein
MPLREWHRRATIKGHAQNCQCHTHSAEFEGLPCGGSGLRECYSRVDPRCAQEPSGRVGKHERYFCPRCEQILDKPIHSSLLVPEGTACGPAHLIKPSDPATLAGLLNLTGEERNRKAAPTSAGRCPTCKSSDPKRGVSRSPVTGCPDSFHDRKRKAICPSCGSDDPETTITDDGITTTPADWSCGNCRHPFHTAPQGKEGR